jgi:2-iminobutanoate/2-iminopropanoate deaminase
MTRPTDTNRRSTIKTQRAPAAIGPYSQAKRAGDTLYCSGQIAIDPNSGQLIENGIEAETEQVLDNIEAVLHSAGMEFGNVVRCTVYLSDIDDYGQVNEVYSRYFSESPPSRIAVEVANLPRGAGVEIACIAVD